MFFRFGVCCVVSLSTCGARVSVNGSYISKPSTSQGSCKFGITAEENVCNIRLDFAKFVLHGPTDNSSPNLGFSKRFNIKNF